MTKSIGTVGVETYNGLHPIVSCTELETGKPNQGLCPTWDQGLW
jgi:hypothetical protein